MKKTLTTIILARIHNASDSDISALRSMRPRARKTSPTSISALWSSAAWPSSLSAESIRRFTWRKPWVPSLFTRSW